MHPRDITIIIPTSVLPSHPSTSVIDETISTIRYHFPENEIILQIDGLREEQNSLKKDYDEYKNRVLWKCLHEWKNVLPIVFNEHSHQTNMMKETIDLIRTPLLLYVEADAPLVTDEFIDWQKCADMFDCGKANTIRFHFESQIPKEHEHLMHGIEDGFMKTSQWSQRPHISRVSYYRKVVLPNSWEKFFIEDKFHGKVIQDCLLYKSPKKNVGWNRHKLWIYHPDGSIKRSYHLDGREGTRKFTSDDDIMGYKE